MLRIYNNPPTISVDEMQSRIAAVDSMKPAELRAEFARVWGCESYSHNYALLRRRIKWRLMALCAGGIPAVAIQKAGELADTTRLRERVPYKRGCKTMVEEVQLVPQERTAVQTPLPEPERSPEARMSRPGSHLCKSFNGKDYMVYALNGNRYVYAGVIYNSLTSVARQIAGYKVSGNRFFSTRTEFSDR